MKPSCDRNPKTLLRRGEARERKRKKGNRALLWHKLIETSETLQ